MYSMVTIVNNTVLYIWKLLREQLLKVLRRKKIVINVQWQMLTRPKFFVYIMGQE